MAWLEKQKSGNLLLCFRYGGTRLKRSSRTTNAVKAEQMRLRVEENIELIERGRLEVPQDADLLTFLISDGRLSSKPKVIAQLTLGLLFRQYRESLPRDSAEQDFAELVSQCGSSLYAEQFLTSGFRSLPRRVRHALPCLRRWPGIAGLKQQLREFVGLSESSTIHVAGRSANLMQLAASAMSRQCQHILTTDAEWPSYREILGRAFRQAKRSATVMPLMQSLEYEQLTVGTLIDRIANCYQAQQCDGLFLSDITFQGVRLPIRQIVARLQLTETPPKFVVVDGAQAANQFPIELSPLYCDIYLMSTQKWLRAYQPLSVAVCCNPTSSGAMRESIARCRRDDSLQDALFDFSTAAEREDFPGFGETVNVTPMITASAALATATLADSKEQCQQRHENSQKLFELLEHSPWQPVPINEAMRSGAILLQNRSAACRAAPPNQIRKQFHRNRISLTSYPFGIVRVSLPSRPLAGRESRILRKAFKD